MRRSTLLHLTLPLAALGLMPGATTWAEPPAPAANTVHTTPQPPAPAPVSTSHMQVRVFEGFEGHGTGRRGRETPLAVDTDLELVTCPDGNVQINSMTVGGAPLAQDQPMAECNAGSRQGSVRFDDGQQREVTATAGTPPAPAPATPPAPRCDPVTWRCAEPASVTPTAPPPR